MEKQFNVCFGCNETGDVKTCKKQDCFAYDFRSSSIEMDHELNSRNHEVMERNMKVLLRTGMTADQFAGCFS